MTYFGVTPVPSSGYVRPLSPDRLRATYVAQILAAKAPTHVQSTDGTFAIKTPPGQWDLIIAGPDFARYVVLGATAHRWTGATLDITLARGRTINGTVTDGSGAPVDHALVKITQTDSCPAEDNLWGLACGNYSTFTNPDGSFQISNFAEVHDNASPVIAASLGEHISLPHRIDGSDTFVNLEVLPSGSMDGSLIGSFSKNEQILIVAQPVTKVTKMNELILVSLERNGSFRFERLPAGEYRVGAWRFELGGRALLNRRVTVSANSKTSVVLTMNTQ